MLYVFKVSEFGSFCFIFGTNVVIRNLPIEIEK